MVAKNSTVSGGLRPGGLGVCHKANEVHEGMTWGAVAKKRTTATGLDEQTLSNQPASLFDLPRWAYATDRKKEAFGFGAERTSLTGRTRKKKRENPLDRLTSFREDTLKATRILSLRTPV